MFSRRFFLLFSYFISFSVYSGSWISETKISKFISHDSGNIIVEFDDSVVNEGCVNKKAVVLSKKNSNFKELHNALLAAFLNQNFISGYVNSCSEEWSSNGIAYLIRVDILRKAI